MQKRIWKTYNWDLFEEDGCNEHDYVFVYDSVPTSWRPYFDIWSS